MLNAIKSPGIYGPALAALLIGLTGCIEQADDILYGTDNPDPYPPHWDVAELDSILPNEGYPTDHVIIHGSGFNTSSEDQNIIAFGTSVITALRVWPDSLELVVPAKSPLDYFFTDTVQVRVALQGSYDWSNEISYYIKAMASPYVATVYPASHDEEAFNKPRGLAADSLGNIYLMNEAMRAVYKDVPSGGVREVLSFGNKLSGGMRMGPDGYIYAASQSTDAIYRIAPDAGGGRGEEWATVPSPWGMDFDSYGNLFVVDNNKGDLYRISSDAVVTKVADLPGDTEKGYCRVFEEVLYVNENPTGFIFKIPFTADSVGVVDTVATVIDGRVNDITFAADGTMFVTANTSSGSALVKVELTGLQSELVILDGDLGFMTWQEKVLYISSLTSPVYRVVIHDAESAPYHGRD